MSLAVSTTLTPTNSSDANFRAWGSAVGVKLAAMGLVQTADTGQINWTTVLAAVGTNTSQGYEIWRFADTLQATIPVFIKIEYGSGAATANPSFWFTFGAGSNGTGSLTGVLSVRTQFQFTATASGITVYWSGDTNRFAFAFNGVTVGTSFLVSAERTVDTSGVVTGEAILFTCFATSAYSLVAWNCVTGPYTTFETTYGALGPANAPLGTSGTQVAIYPCFHNKGVFLPFGLGTFGYVDATIGAGVTISFTVYGSTHTFMPIGVGKVNSSLQRTAASTSVMMRYE